LNAVSGTAADDVWAVGDGAVILHCDGNGWSRDMRIPSDVAHAKVPPALYGVWAASPKNVWAVGSAGLILHFDGAQWTTNDVGNAVFCDSISSICSGNLRAIWGQASAVVAVGGAADLKSVLARLDGTSWTYEHRAEGARLLSVAGAPTGELLAVGLSAWRGDAQSWSPVALLAGVILNSVSVVDANHAWAASGGGIYRWDGTSWSADPAAAGRATKGVFALSTTDIWAVGDTLGAGALILHGDGRTWTSEQPPDGVQQLNAVFAVDNAVFAAGNGTILRRR
jgi:hypothetical protein